jgi:hypothetical protein
VKGANVVLAPLPLRLARNRYLTPEVPFMVTLENEQVPFPFADALVFPLRDAPPKEPLSNSGSKVRAHVPEAVDAHWLLELMSRNVNAALIG